MISLKTDLQHPVRFVFGSGDLTNDLFTQTLAGIEYGDILILKVVLIIVLRFQDILICRIH